MSTNSSIIGFIVALCSILGAVFAGVWGYSRFVIMPFVLQEVKTSFVARDLCSHRHGGDDKVDAKIEVLETQVADLRGDLKAIKNDLQWIRSTMERGKGREGREG